jgi:hypothetical protein
MWVLLEVLILRGKVSIPSLNNLISEKAVVHCQ